MVRAFSHGQELWDPSHRFETSWLLPPWVLFGIRALICLYIFVTVVFVEIYYCEEPSLGGCAEAGDEFSYFTVLTYWGLGFYFLAAAVQTATYAATGRALLDRLPRVLQALHALLYTTVVVFPFVVTVVYWVVLYSGKWFALEFDAWRNISEHALNSVFALFEVLVPRTNPPSPWHMVWLIVILGAYLGLAYLTEATKGFYTYSFLNPSVTSKGIIVAYVFGILIGTLIVFGIVYGVICLRRWLTESKARMEGKFAHHGSWRRDRDVEMSAPNGR